MKKKNALEKLIYSKKKKKISRIVAYDLPVVLATKSTFLVPDKMIRSSRSNMDFVRVTRTDT